MAGKDPEFRQDVTAATFQPTGYLVTDPPAPEASRSAGMR